MKHRKPKHERKSQIFVGLTPEEHKAVKEIAEQETRSVSGLVRRWVLLDLGFAAMMSKTGGTIKQEELEEGYTFRVDTDTIFVVKNRKVYEVTRGPSERSPDGPAWRERPDLDYREML